MTGSLWQRIKDGITISRQRADWPDFAGSAWLDGIMDVTVTDRHHAKQGRSTGRWILHQQRKSLAVYLKRHYRLNRWRGVLAALWPQHGWSPALQEWQNLEWARDQGLPVPNNVAAGEIIGPWGKLQSFLAVEELNGMLPLHEAIPLACEHLDPIPFRIWKRGLVAEMARLVRELHKRRFFHKDLYLCHFYLPERMCYSQAAQGTSGWTFNKNVYLIDFHRLGHHQLTWPLWQIKDLAQLAYSSEIKGVEPCDRLLFWRNYRESRQDSLFSKWLKRALQLKWQRYRKHNDKRRASSMKYVNGIIGNEHQSINNLQLTTDKNQ